MHSKSHSQGGLGVSTDLLILELPDEGLVKVGIVTQLDDRDGQKEIPGHNKNDEASETERRPEVHVVQVVVEQSNSRHRVGEEGNRHLRVIEDADATHEQESEHPDSKECRFDDWALAGLHSEQGTSTNTVDVLQLLLVIGQGIAVEREVNVSLGHVESVLNASFDSVDGSGAVHIEHDGTTIKGAHLQSEALHFGIWKWGVGRT